MAPAAEAAFCGAGPVHLLNAAVLPGPGRWELTPVSTRQAAALVAEHGYRSAIGHAATAQLLSRLLGISCPVDRRACEIAPGESALVLHLAARLPEGVVLTEPGELEAIGYSLALLTRLQPDARSSAVA